MQLLAFVLTLFGALCVGVGAIAWLPFFDRNTRLDLVGVLVFVVGGSLFYLLGSWLEKRVKPPKPRTFVLKQGDKKFITAMLVRDRRRYLILGLFLLLFDALMVFAALQPEDAPSSPGSDRYAWIAYLFGGATMLLLAGVGVLFLYQSFRLWNPAATRLYDLLTKTPDKVTNLTVHLYQHEMAPGTLGRQIFVAINVEGEELRTGATEEQWVLLRQYIQLHSPHAAYREVEHAVSGG